MLRKILCDYEFVYQGKTYKEYGLYLGDTTVPNQAKRKDFTAQIICYTLKLTEEELGKMIRVRYWDIDRSKLELAGFVFVRLDIYFYPSLNKK